MVIIEGIRTLKPLESLSVLVEIVSKIIARLKYIHPNLFTVRVKQRLNYTEAFIKRQQKISLLLL